MSRRNDINEHKQNYWIVTQLFYPDETSTAFIMTKIAELLAKKKL